MLWRIGSRWTKIGSRWMDAVQRPPRERTSWPSPEGQAGVSHLKNVEKTWNTGGTKKKASEAGGQWGPMNKGRPKTGEVGKGQAVHRFVGHCMA